VSELLDAYVAMGGEPDGGGCVDATTLIKTIKEEFQMTIDIEKLIEEIDEDGSGEIEFDEFKALL
jgi:calmodulin